MRMRSWLAALLLAAALPAAAWAQEGHAHGDVAQRGGWLGILFDFDSAGGTRVARVVPGSPAERAGVRQGDQVLRVNGRAATEDAVGGLRDHLQRGDTVRLRVRQDGREADRVVIAGERPARMAMGRMPGMEGMPGMDRRIVIRMDTMQVHLDSLFQRMDSLRMHLREFHGDSIVLRLDRLNGVRDSVMRHLSRGVMQLDSARAGVLPYMLEFGPRAIAGAEFAEMNPGLGHYFHTDQGLLVLQVSASTPAGRAGLQAGDVVTEVNGTRLEKVRDLRAAFARANGQEVRLTVLRDGQRRQIAVRWERPAPDRQRREVVIERRRTPSP